MKTKEKLEGGWGVLAQVLLGAILIGAVMAVPTAIYLKFETRTEENSLRLVTMWPVKKLEELKSYHGVKIIGYFDNYRVIKIERDGNAAYLNLSVAHYELTKGMQNLDIEALTRFEATLIYGNK